MSSFSQSEALGLLARAPAAEVKLLAERLLERLGEVTVLVNRTGLVMLPYVDTSTGTRFLLGEVMVAESRVRLAAGAEGYAAVLGRDLEQALAIALIDAARQPATQPHDDIEAFLTAQAAAQHAADDALLKQVEATRVELETF
jgi:alpha-D-ribose 1-methylphosphonate 5-triphosphate synthase subunit PhnG